MSFATDMFAASTTVFTKALPENHRKPFKLKFQHFQKRSRSIYDNKCSIYSSSNLSQISKCSNVNECMVPLTTFPVRFVFIERIQESTLLSGLFHTNDLRKTWNIPSFFHMTCPWQGRSVYSCWSQALNNRTLNTVHRTLCSRRFAEMTHITINTAASRQRQVPVFRLRRLCHTTCSDFFDKGSYQSARKRDSLIYRRLDCATVFCWA